MARAISLTSAGFLISLLPDWLWPLAGWLCPALLGWAWLAAPGWLWLFAGCWFWLWPVPCADTAVVMSASTNVTSSLFIEIAPSSILPKLREPLTLLDSIYGSRR